MICGSLLVFFLSLLTLVELTSTIERNVTCGENIKINDCNGTNLCHPNETVSMQLRKKSGPLLEIQNVTTVDSNCTENGKFCLEVTKDRKRVTLTINSVTFTDEGSYRLYIRRSNGEASDMTIHVFVYGVCEPNVSRIKDELTCEGTMKNTSNPTIDWMSKERKRYSSVLSVEKETENYITWRITLKLTDETRQMTMCCTASYTQSKREEKQNCLPVTAGSYKLNEDTNRTKIMIPILCVLCIAIAFALYVYCRRRRSFARPRRERTDSEQGLISDIENTQEENTKETQSDPLQGPKDKV